MVDCKELMIIHGSCTTNEKPLLSSILVYVKSYEHFCGEMVRKASYEGSLGEGAERIAFVLALLLFQELLIPYTGHEEMKLRFGVVDQVIVYDNLVE